MPFKKGQKRTPGSGRKKGQITKDRQMLLDKAKELGVDPFEILLHMANGDWKKLGYDEAGSVRADKYSSWLELTISTETRTKAASAACSYMLPALKAIDLKGTDLGKILNVNVSVSGAPDQPKHNGPNKTPA